MEGLELTEVDTIYHGDSIEIMTTFKDNSIDALIGDSPYSLGFMGLSWDTFKSMGFLRFTYKWAKKALRILKPGAYLLNFSAPRKYHLMACGVELAGFKIKDMISWAYGQGMPKGPNISAAIDKDLGVFELREKIGVRYRHGGGTKEEYMGRTQDPEVEITKPYSEEAKKWEGWGTGLSPAVECIIVAQKPREKTYAYNVMKHGLGGINIDKCRIHYNPAKETDSRIYNPEKNITRGSHDNATIRYAPDGNEFPMYNSPKGRWPSNFILSHHPECKLIGVKKVGSGNPQHNSKIHRKGLSEKGAFNSQNCGFDVNKGQGLGNYGTEIIEAYECHPECPIRLLDEQTGELGTSGRKSLIGHDYNSQGMFKGGWFTRNNQYFDKGGASRFFYCAKVHPNERNAGCENLYWKIQGDNFKKITKKQYEQLPEKQRAEGNPITTLKPITLMRYLARLVTPPGGTVLDPFSGSGTTGIACIIEGFHYILIEKRDAFVKYVIPNRLAYWKDPKTWMKLKDHPLLPKTEVLKNMRQNFSLDNWISKDMEA